MTTDSRRSTQFCWYGLRCYPVQTPCVGPSCSTELSNSLGRIQWITLRAHGTSLTGFRCPSMSNTLANLVGTAAAICSITSFAPQAIKIWKERDASAISLRTYSLTVTCFMLWVIYGVMTDAWPVTVANACALVMASLVLVMKWRFRDTS